MRSYEVKNVEVSEGESSTAAGVGQITPNETTSLNSIKPDFYEFNNSNIQF
jgi:hypothetical protein